jgi:RHS repeat-associated protein
MNSDTKVQGIKGTTIRTIWAALCAHVTRAFAYSREMQRRLVGWVANPALRGVGNSGFRALTQPTGFPQVTLQYDEFGRMISQTDASGRIVQLSHDTNNSTETVTDRRGNAVNYTYDARGNITRQVNGLGHVTQFEYDANDNETVVTDPLGRKRIRTYNAGSSPLTDQDPTGATTTNTYFNVSGSNDPTLLTKTVDALGRETSFGYTPQKLPFLITDPQGRETRMAYDAKGNLQEMTDSAGNVTRYTYDSTGNRLSETDASGAVTTYTYDSTGNQLTATRTRTNSQGHTETLTTTRTYDAENRLLTETDPRGRVTRTRYSAGGRLLSETDPLGNTVAYTYDEMGRLTETKRGLGVVTRTSYDPEGAEKTAQDERGFYVTRTLDVLGRETERSVGRSEPALRTEYDAGGQVVKHTDGRDHAVTYTYDGAGRKLSEANALGHLTRFEYNAVGNVKKVIDPLGRAMTHDYDANNRKIKTTYPDNSFQTWEYDTIGRKLKDTDRAGRTTSYGYDALGRLNTVTDHAGGVTTYGYDAVGQKVSQTDALGRITRWAYDSAGRMVARTLPGGEVERFGFDDAGRNISFTDFDGKTTTYQYDDAGRLIERNFPVGVTDKFLYWSESTRLSNVIRDGRQTDYWGHSQAGELAAQGSTDPFVGFNFNSTSYEYDASGNRTTSYLAGAYQTGLSQIPITYEYDAARRVTAVIDPTRARTTVSYDAAGNRTGISYPNGAVSSLSYDSLNRLMRQETRAAAAQGGGVLLSVSYEYDAADQRTKATTLMQSAGGAIVRESSYQYDALGRLVQDATVETQPGQTLAQVSAGAIPAFRHTTIWRFDAVGNRSRLVTRKQAGAQAPVERTEVYTVDVNDRISGVSTYAGYFTGNASVTGTPIGSVTLTWNPTGTLASERRIVTQPDPQNPLNTQTSTTIKQLRWDDQQRLIRIAAGKLTVSGSNPSPTDPAITRVVAYGYDHEGIRTWRRAYPAEHEAAIANNTWYQLPAAERQKIAYSRYVYDKTADYPQLLAEYGSDNYPRVVYPTLAPGQDSAQAGLPGHRSGVPSGSAGAGLRLGEVRFDFKGYSNYSYPGSDTPGNDPQTNPNNPQNLKNKQFSVERYYLGDGLGSTLAVMQGRVEDKPTSSSQGTIPNSFGTLIHRFAYDAYGKPLTNDETQFTQNNPSTNPGSTDTSAINQAFGVNSQGSWGTSGYPDQSINASNREGTRLTTWGEITGTEDEPDENLVYLRARTYDPSLGVFLSRDPHPGSPNRPATLHDYSYASNDPVNRSDPSGEFTMGGMMSGINIAFNLATVAYSVYDSFFGPKDDDDSERQTLWDAVMQMMLNGYGSSIGTTGNLGSLGLSSNAEPKENHHSIPIYLCGARKQYLARLTVTDHRKIHKDLLTASAIVNGFGFIADRLIFKTKKLHRPAIIRVARTPGGRGAIVGGLLEYYSNHSYATYFNKSNPPHLQSLDSIFAYESAKFVTDRKNHSSWPLCTRGG